MRENELNPRGGGRQEGLKKKRNKYSTHNTRHFLVLIKCITYRLGENVVSSITCPTHISVSAAAVGLLTRTIHLEEHIL